MLPTFRQGNFNICLSVIYLILENLHWQPYIWSACGFVLVVRKKVFVLKLKGYTQGPSIVHRMMIPLKVLMNANSMLVLSRLFLSLQMKFWEFNWHEIQKSFLFVTSVGLLFYPTEGEEAQIHSTLLLQLWNNLVKICIHSLLHSVESFAHSLCHSRRANRRLFVHSFIHSFVRSFAFPLWRKIYAPILRSHKYALCASVPLFLLLIICISIIIVVISLVLNLCSQNWILRLI